MIKAIFFDVDGTLISHKYGHIPNSTKESIQKMKNKGIKLFLATGRHMMEIEKLPVNELIFDGYVTLNGQICISADKTLLYDASIESCDIKKMVSVFEQKTIPIMIIEKNRMYINYINDAVYKAQKAISTPVPEIGNYAGDKVYQFIVFDDKNEAKNIVKQLSNCKMSRWNDNAVDIISKNGGKVIGIQNILQHYDIIQSEIMAFGDGENDIDMLRYAGIGVAMGNADVEVKKHAKYITDDIDSDGIKKALKYYGVL